MLLLYKKEEYQNRLSEVEKKFDREKEQIHDSSGEVYAMYSDGDAACVNDHACFHDNWIMDSAYSYHMCSNRNWFSTYDSVQGEVVLPNDTVCKIANVWCIWAKMHDGVVRTLHGVRHVLELKKNMISLSFLDSNGFIYS